MSTQPYHLYAERIDASKNMARYYSLSIEPTLFGDTSLIRSWGRIGSRGQRMVHVFKTEPEAFDFSLELLRIKTRRGYRLRGDRPGSDCGFATTKFESFPLRTSVSQYCAEPSSDWEEATTVVLASVPEEEEADEPAQVGKSSCPLPMPFRDGLAACTDEGNK